MTPENQCPYFRAKNMHLYVPYRVRLTGQTGEACHGCGREKETA